MDKGKEKIVAEEEEADDAHHHVTSMTKRAKSIGSRPSQTNPCTIYRVPTSIRQGDTHAYEPQIISIGPYHRTKHSLQTMEEHKWSHLNAILWRDHDHSLADYFKEIQPLEGQARSCYSENIDLGSDEFVEMMVLDGCFIVEFLINVDHKRPIEAGPIYSTKWMVPLIGQDMLLLENQLPFFIIQRLFDVITQSNTCSLVDLALSFFHCIVPMNKESIQPPKEVHHLLHLFHSHLIPTPPEIRLQQMGHSDHHSTSSSCALFHRRRNPPSPPRSIPSMTEIRRAGIKFKKKKADSFLDVTYQKGVIQIPTLTIYDSTTNNLFRNMIALEQCYPKGGTYFSSYTIFMYCILETTKDATVLKQNRIIEHWLGSDDEVVHMFKRMCKGLTIDFYDNYLSGMINHVAEVCETSWHTWRATLMRDYFSTPWSILQLEATVLALVFTLVQTFLAVLDYYRPRAK